MKGQPSVGLAAINFGIFESDTGFRVYLIGSTEYEEHDDEWACNEDFVPHQKHFGKNLKSESWQDAMAEVETLISTFMESDEYPDSILAMVDHVTCGFDEGELKRIKTARNNG